MLALATAEGANFEETVAASVVGYEVMTRIGMAATVQGQYDRGFHPTGTTGVFGAAAAASRLLGLDAASMRSALGISLSLAAGSMAFLVDGAWTKRLHPGWARAWRPDRRAAGRRRLRGPARRDLRPRRLPAFLQRHALWMPVQRSG